MSMPGREAVIEALLALLGKAANFTTIERGYRPRNRINTAQTPYLGLVEGDEVYPHGAGVMTLRPRLIEMETMAVIYCMKGTTPPDPNLAKELNQLIDAVEVAIAYPERFRTPQNLGIEGILTVRINGTIIKDPGYLNGQAAALIPIWITVAELQLQLSS